MKTINKEQLFDIYERLAALHVDMEELDFQAVSDLDDVFTYVSRAVNSFHEYCEKNKVYLPYVF